MNSFLSNWRLNGTIGQQPWLGRGGALLPIVALGAAVVGGLLAVQQTLLVVGAILAMPLALAIMAWPDVATLAVLFILYSNAAVVAVKFHGVPYLIGSSVPVLLIFPLAGYLVFRRQKLIINPVLLLILLFLSIQLLGVLFARDVRAATSNLVVFAIEGIGLYFLITNAVRTPEMLRRAIWILLLAGAILGGIPFYQQVTQTFDNNYGGFAQLSDTGFRTGEETLQGEVRQFRLAGAIGEQNHYARIVMMLMPLGLFRFWGERSKSLRVLALVATGLITLGVALTFSRGAAVGFVLLLVVMVWMRIIKLYHFALIVMGVGLLLVALPQYRTRLSSLQSLSGLVAEGGDRTGEADGSIEGRATEMLAAALVFADHPLIGVGPGMFRYYSKEYGDRVGLRILEGNREAHSLFLGIAADHGALGLICFLAILYLTLRNLAHVRKRWQQERPELANMATGFMLAIISYLATGLFLHFAYVRYFWLMLALAGAASYVASAAVMREPAFSETEKLL